MTGESSGPRLQLSGEQMRQMGRRIVDMLVDHFETLREQPVTAVDDWSKLGEKLDEPFAEEGTGFEGVLGRLERDVFSTMMHVDHPRFFAFVPSPGNFVGAMADALASGFNVFAGTWVEGSGPAAVELVTVDWLRRTCGMPESTLGLFVSGGSVANMTALAVARRVRLKDCVDGAAVYFSDQTHSSVERGLRVLGFAPEQFRRIPCDEEYRLGLAALEREVAADRAAGRVPFCVVANAGTTNTGAVDPLRDLAGFCRRENLWLHADGAYGAAAALSEQGRALLDGLGEVDSLAVDPHKWLFQPFECGCVLVREGSRLQETFRILPEYLQDVHRRGEFNFCDHGIQLTRGFRALKLWMSLKVFGVAAFRDAMDWGFRLAEIAERRLRRSRQWEIVTPARMAIVSFRHASPEAGDEFHARLVEAMFADGYAALTSTMLGGRTTFRMCTINPRTTEADIEATIDRLESLAAGLPRQAVK